MAIGFRAAGAESAGTGDPAGPAGLPAGWQPGDLHILVINLKGSTVTINTPAGWTKPANSEVTGGAGTLGTDAGPNRVALFSRIAQAGDTAPTIDLSAAPNAHHEFVLGYTKDAGETWSDVVCTTGADTTGSSTSYSAAGAAAIQPAAGDWCAQCTGFNGDAGTPGSRTFSWGGVTLGSYTAAVQDDTTTAGGDLRTDIGHAPYTSGSVSGAPTLDRVWTAGNASFAGATVFFLLSVALAPVSDVPGLQRHRHLLVR